MALELTGPTLTLAGCCSDIPVLTRAACVRASPLAQPYQRTLYCEVGQSRAAFTSRYRLIYSPRIKPQAKGGTTVVGRNYQAHKHHAAYWRPLQLYDLQADQTEQLNLINPAERDKLSMSPAELRALRSELTRLQQALRSHLGEQREARECAV